MRIALATAVAAFALDQDLPWLQGACARAGLQAEILAWDDPTVSWARFDAVLLRSTWDYTHRLDAFLDWCAYIEHCSRLLNPLETVRWNADKHYLGELAARGLPVVPCCYLESLASLPGPIQAQSGEFVLKPCVGAGAKDAGRFGPEQHDAALAHARRLLESGRSVLLQPFLSGVEGYGETALIHINGRYTHAIRKGPLLPRGGHSSQALFAEEDIQPRIATEAEHAVADAILAALPQLPLYARVDLLPSAEGPKLLELEMVEPSLFFEASPSAADKLIHAMLELLHGPPRRSQAAEGSG